jgi:hypothetical protein
MSKMLENYRQLVKELSDHWNKINEVNPNYFTYNDLSHICNSVNERRMGGESYEVTQLRLTNGNSCVEFSVKVGDDIIDCPSYILSRK